MFDVYPGYVVSLIDSEASLVIVNVFSDSEQESFGW